jgi:hypothetical protein
VSGGKDSLGKGTGTDSVLLADEGSDENPVVKVIGDKVSSELGVETRGGEVGGPTEVEVTGGKVSGEVGVGITGDEVGGATEVVEFV